MKKQLLLGAIASSAMVFGNLLVAPTIYALSLTSSTADFCNTANFTGSTSCGGPYSGNDSTAEVNGTAKNSIVTMFGYADWTQVGKLDAQFGTQNNLVSVSAPKQGSQTWSFNGTFDPFQYVNLVFVVKGSNSFIGYLWDGTATTGSFKTLGLVNNGGKTPDLSHLSIYTRGVVEKPSVVVVPPVVTPPAVTPPTEIPPVDNPPTEAPPTEIPPTENPPTENPPAEDPPTEVPPVENPPIENPPAVVIPPSADFAAVIVPNDPTAVPTPAAVLPVLGGLFGAAKRRKNK